MTRVSVTVAMIACCMLSACGSGENEGQSTLRYSLGEGSKMSTLILRRPPRFERSISGTFDVVVTERLREGFVFKISGLRFRSVEDGRYDVATDAGILAFHSPEIEVELMMSVNGEPAEVYHAAMAGEDRELLASAWPPVFRDLVLLSERYALMIEAEASGR